MKSHDKITHKEIVMSQCKFTCDKSNSSDKSFAITAEPAIEYIRRIKAGSSEDIQKPEIRVHFSMPIL